MSNDEKNLAIATFRFGIISDFVTGVRLEYGEKERLLDQKSNRFYAIPYSERTHISRATIENWILDYKIAGHRLEGLYPKVRMDKGLSRSLSSEIKLAIKELKKESPDLNVPTIIKTLKHKKLIPLDEKINFSTVYRYLRSEDLKSVNEEAKDKRHFEASHPNEIWQSDVMHGPLVKVDDKEKKSYLIAIIDDHSRFIIHAEFYLSESRTSFLDALRQAIVVRGLPQKLYIDNGSCYKALHLEQVAAQLGIAIKHSRPYVPQGRGKIERWFRFVRENFISYYDKTNSRIEKLDLLNHYFKEWVDEYNNKIHSTTKESPYDRYRKNLECVRPAPSHIINYFRQIEFRKVKRDRSVRLFGHLFEAPVNLIDKNVELRFHPEDLSNIEIFFNNQSFGFIVKVDAQINSKIGRDWRAHPEKSREDVIKPTEEFKSGELFGKKNDIEGVL